MQVLHILVLVEHLVSIEHKKLLVKQYIVHYLKHQLKVQVEYTSRPPGRTSFAALLRISP